MELLKLFQGRLRVGVIDTESEAALKARCAILMVPSISIFHRDHHLKTIAKIQDWEVYAKELPALMTTAFGAEAAE